MAEYIYKKCEYCGGDGKRSPGDPAIEGDCSRCKGSGLVYWGEIRDEIIGEE